jgi:glycogen operon protein
MRADPLLADRILIAEPWDIGENGYQLGNFRPPFLEWNDRFRDDVRRFWRGDAGIATLATRLAGSADVFGEQASRSVNFLAAHDGFTLADTVAYAGRHNWANGEQNRDGHGENFSWNCGVEGLTADAAVLARRDGDLRALLATLFASAGTILLTAGDEFGRSQHGNNNAYAQDNAVSWIDWLGRDVALQAYTCALAEWRAARLPGLAQFPLDGEWLACGGQPMKSADWEDPATQCVRYRAPEYDIRLDRAARRVVLEGCEAVATPTG